MVDNKVCSSSYNSEIELNDRIELLLNELRVLFERRHSDVQSRWARSLPFGDYVIDRWEKARILGFGEGSSVYDSSLIFGNVIVGRNTWIGPFTLLDGSGDLKIGDYCSISAGVQIYTHDTVKWATSGGNCNPEYASVSIGDNCYIGPNVVISKGVVIGNKCVIGANSFVNINIPCNHRAWGIPAKIIK